MRDAARRLREAGADTPELDARLLAGRAAGLDQAALISASRDPMDAGAAAALESLVARRASGEPVARILGLREFWGRDFCLGPETLVPRPDSETLIEAALSRVGRRQDLLVADLGTGSGCLLVTLLCELPEARGVGVDLSTGALATARTNACRHDVSDRAGFICGSWGDALKEGFHLVVCNPPYIASQDISLLMREVAGHEPRLALEGGEDGLEAYRALFPSLRGMLAPDGLGVVELGAGQAPRAGELAGAAGLRVSATVADLSGTPRALVLQVRS